MYATRLHKKLLKKCTASPQLAKCLALCIKVKRRTSYYRTYRDIAHVAGISESTVRRMMPILIRRGLVKRTNGTFFFTPLHAPKLTNEKTGVTYKQKYGDIILTDANVDFTNIKTIVTALRALRLVEVRKARQYYEEISHKAFNPDRFTPLREVKTARRKIARNRSLKYKDGEYHDEGYSYRYLGKKFGCGQKSVKDSLMYGVNHYFFSVIKGYAERIVHKGEVKGFAVLNKGQWSPNSYTFINHRNFAVYSVSPLSLCLLAG